jgi:hypothetical protein
LVQWKNIELRSDKLSFQYCTLPTTISTALLETPVLPLPVLPACSKLSPAQLAGQKRNNERSDQNSD